MILNLTNLQFKDDSDTDGVQILDEYPLQVGKFQIKDTATILTLLSVILNLTNLQFKDYPDTDGVQIID